MRAVEDHHVDRLGVEAWQHVKLTSTNCSIGLIVDPFAQDPSGSQANVQKVVACSGKIRRQGCPTDQLLDYAYEPVRV